MRSFRQCHEPQDDLRECDLGLRRSSMAICLRPLTLLTFLVSFALGGLARAAQPSIAFFQLFQNDQVLIHFNTEPNRTYVLQYTDSPPNPTNGFQGAIWSNLFTAPAYPYPDHFVVPHARTAPQRFYRLFVTP